MWWRTSNCSSLLIYRPREDERLSWPGWLTYSGRLTHISGHPSATGRAQDGERTLARDWRSVLSHADQPHHTASTKSIETIGTYILFQLLEMSPGLTLSVVRILDNLYTVSQKNKPHSSFISLPDVGRFKKKSFTLGFSKEFAIQLSSFRHIHVKCEKNQKRWNFDIFNTITSTYF